MNRFRSHADHRVLTAVVAIAAVLAILVGAGISAAQAAIGSVSGVTISVVSDGTVPFDADDAPGNDSGATNGIVRTSDFITYQWAYSVATAGDITLRQTLPTGLKWDASSTTNCSQGASAIAGQVLTCTIVNASAGAGAYNVKAKVLNVANGASVAASVTATTGGVTSNTVNTAVSAAPKAMLDAYLPTSVGPVYVLGTGVNAGIPGFRFPFSADLYMPIDASKGVRGLESLQSPLTFTVQPPAAYPTATLWSCGVGGLSPTTQPSPNGGGTNAVIASGSWTCAQPGGPGTPITVTVTGANTTLDTYPSRSVLGNLLDATKAYFAVGSVNWWIPESAFPTGAITSFTTQVTGYDPNGLSGASNFGTGYAPAQEPGAPCITTKTPSSNCATLTLDRLNTNLQISSSVQASTSTTSTPIPGGTVTTAGDGPVTPGQSFAFRTGVTNRATNGPATGVTVCAKWDPALATIDDTQPPVVILGVTSLAYVVEYGNHVFASDALRRTGTCDAAGDPEWYSSIAAAGGPSAVTQVRVRMLDPYPAGSGSTTMIVPVIRTTQPLPDGSPVPFFFAMQSSAGNQVSSYVPATNANSSSGGRALAASAAVRNTVSWDASSGVPGDVRQVSVQPTVTTPDGATGVTAQDVRVSVTLSSPCAAYQVGSASLTPISVTPPTPGSCTGGGAGQTLVFDLGPWPVNTPVPAVNFNTVLSPLTATPSSIVATSTITSASDLSTNASAVRTASSTLPVSALASFGVTKTSSASTATPGVPYTYTIGWANRLPTTAGTASFVDVLPFNGDSRGTTGLSGLTVNSVTTSKPAVTVWYTSDPSAAVETAVHADPSGMTGVTWSTVKPATVTAIQFRTDELVSGTVESADINVTPGTLSRSGTIKNDVWGKASGIPAPVQGASLVTMTSSTAELSGNVYNDLDYSFSKTPGDTPVPNPTVRITGGYSFGPDGVDNGGTGDDVPVTVPIDAEGQANGDYLFPGVLPGRYTVEATAPAGSNVAVSPPMPILLASGATVTGKDFGIQVDVTPSVAVDDVTSVPMDAGATPIDVLANDEINDSSAVVTATGATSNGGTVTIAADGKSVNYTPAAGFAGTDTFTYTITDKARHTSTATVTVNVVAAPAAQNDTAQTGEDQAVTVDVLANDLGVDLRVTGTGSNLDGTVAINPDNTVTFTPNTGFTGATTFTYTVTDSAGQTDSATVTINVIARPIARDDSATVAQGSTVTVNVLANDDATQPTVTSATSANGSAVVNPDNTVSFTPSPGFSGPAVVDYTITDAVGQTASARIFVTVVEGPVARDDSATTGQGVPVLVDVLANDDGDNLTVTIASDPANGTAIVESDGRVTNTPVAGFAGTDTFEYTVTDPVGQTSTATVTITVVAGPVAVDDSALTPEDTAVTVDLLANDVGEGLTLTAVGTSADGTIVNNGDGTITFTPNAGFTGATEFTYTVTDSFSNTSTGNVTIRVVQRPAATDDFVATPQGQAVVIDAIANDSGTGLAVTALDVNVNGTATIEADGTVKFTPNAGFVGDTEVGYTITDVVGQTATGTIHIRVVQNPVANPDVAKTPQTTAVTVPVLANDTGDSLSVTSIGAITSRGAAAAAVTAASGTAVINADGTITFTPASGFSGVVTIPYTVTDGIGQTSTTTLTVTVVRAPLAPDVSATTKTATPVTVRPMDKVTGENPRIISVGTTADGTAVLNADGTVTFTARKGFTGKATFTYTVIDDFSQVTVGTITVTVTGESGPPTPPPTTPPVPPTTPPGGTPVGGPTGGLVNTGGDIAGFGIAAVVLLLLGGATVVLARRRRRER
ncbi:tandem-95 repeat protein [Leucobacter viscericola]|uniref:Tandem-95 repeat protein n=1 Tax=Leucobacter viscericola TaxID=2714935 RepID=A0A6G7XFV5_9MICO|nr:Ig-like domain-containing protein [Leucobacter viscericola]QIK63277.1 tandem-95 repeat protein [Leucobacter viscericola]